MRKTPRYRALCLLLALMMICSLAPVQAFASGETVSGDPVTVEVGSNVASSRENDFNKDWKFYLGTSSAAQNKGFDDSGWDDVDLPHDFSIIQSFTTSGEAESGFLPGGTGWYRKTFTMPADAAGKSILLNFDGVYMEAYVYVNGNFVGEHHYGYTNFAIDITDYLVCDGATENVVAVKAVNSIPSSRWYSGSGIYRDVTLIVTDPVHVDLNGTYVTTPAISSGGGTVKVEADIVNDSDSSASVTVTNTVYKKGSATVLATASTTVTVEAGSTETATTSPVVSDPAMWSIENPNLYTVVTELTVDDTVVDTYETEFGFRWFTFSSTGFALNGTNVKLNGVCLHHDQGALGSAAYYDAIYRQLSIMKDMGVNAVRTSHNPADEDFIAICNELGLLVIEETFDGITLAKNGNSYDFARYFAASVDTDLYGATSDMTCAEYAARSVVKRDRNAPCIFAWSYGNEISEGAGNADSFITYCEKYIQWVNNEDGSRIVTIGDNQKGGNNTLIQVIDKILAAGGVAGYNYANTASKLYSLLQNYGGTYNCIIASETSSHVNSRGIYTTQTSRDNADGKYHLTSFDTSAVSWGITAHDSIYNTYQYDGVAGEFVWTGFDYIGEPTPWNGTGSGSVSGSDATPNSSYFGAVDTAGFAKDTFYLYRAQWNKSATTVHLVTAWDSDNYMLSNSKVPVWLYSNAPKVELYLNGTLIGTATRTAVTSTAGHTYYTYTSESNNSSVCTVSNGSDADALYAVFNVDYTVGTLSTKAYDENGNQITLDDSCGRYTVSTPDTVSKLAVSQNKTEAIADGSSLVYISVDVTDADGNLDTTATNNIVFSLTGNGEIVGVDNGDQATTAKFQQSSVLTSTTSANINAYAGKALVIVRTTEDAGSFTVKVTSSGLTGGSATVTTTASADTVTEGLVSYTMVKDYTVKVGTQPTLDTTSTGTLADGSTVTDTIAWETISEDTYNTPGDYTIKGTLTFKDYDAIEVSARLHVIANVIAMRNVATATTSGVVPTLPSVVNGVLANGTVTGEFSVVWDSVSADSLTAVGDIVTVNGTATVMGSETLPVTCAIRVAQEVQTESTNIAPDCYTLEQDIASPNQSDSLTSIVNGATNPGEDTSERWTNWNNRHNSAEATLTLTWATAHQIDSVNLYYRYDGSCKYPESIEFSYSLDGTNYTVIEATAERLTDVTVSNGEAYTYTFANVVNPIALQVKFTQQGGTSSSYCVGLYELEVMTYAAALEYNTSADLSGITVDGTAVEGFNADILGYEAFGTTVAATTDANAGITVLPVYEGVVRILTISEDGSVVKTYEVTVGESEPACEHTNTEIRNAAAATCTTEGYTGDTYCNDCGEKISSGTVIGATGHSWGDWSVTTSATCTTAGSKTRTCGTCGEMQTETIAATGHQHTEVRDAVAAGCETTGYTGDTYCTDCGNQISSGTNIAAKGHSWNDGEVTKEATETENGVMTYTCTVCSATKTEAIVYQKELKAPTVSLTVSKDTSTGKIVIVGKVEDYENLADYYKITAHGILFIKTSQIGTRMLTLNTSGRSRVTFASYSDEGTFTYNLKPTSKSTMYAYCAYLTYTNTKTGETINVYSDMIRGSYNTISG